MTIIISVHIVLITILISFTLASIPTTFTNISITIAMGSNTWLPSGMELTCTC
jgi:hypothetical protein